MRTKIFSLIALALVAISLAGCGAGAAGSVGLSVLGHTKYARHHRTEMTAIRCGWHSYRAVHDFRHHHKVYGTIEGALGARSCAKLIHRR
jgi:hypothetical protein